MIKIKKKKGFTVDISPEVADILGVQGQDELHIIVKNNEVILKAKKNDATHIKKQQKKSDALTERLIKEYEPVLQKLAKT